MEQGERKFLGCSQDVFSPHGADDFCTRENWQTAVLYLAQEMELLGLSSPCTKGGEEAGQASLDVITLVMLGARLPGWEPGREAGLEAGRDAGRETPGAGPE